MLHLSLSKCGDSGMSQLAQRGGDAGYTKKEKSVDGQWISEGVLCSSLKWCHSQHAEYRGKFLYEEG